MNRLAPIVAVLLSCLASASSPAAEPALATNLPPAQEIVARYIEASGGRAAFEKIKSRIMRGEIEVTTLGVSGPFETKSKAPNLQVSRIEFGGLGSLLEGHDGKVAWSKAPGLAVRRKSGGELARVQRSSIFPRELRYAETYSKLETKGMAQVDGQDAWIVEGSVRDAKPDRLYFDRKSGLLVREETTVDSPTGEIHFQIDLSDYREIDGVKVAFAIRIPQPAEIGFRIRFREIQHNVDLPDSDFAPPKE